MGKKSAKFSPLPIEKLIDLLLADQRRLEEKKKLIDKAVEKLSAVRHQENLPVPKIRFVEEKGLKKYLNDAADRWNESAKKIDNTWWGFQDHTLVEHYEKWIHWLWKTVYDELTKVKLLSNQSRVERLLYGKYPRRHIKFWKKAAAFKTTTWVIGDYVVMLETSERPHYLVEMHDANFAESQRNLFKGIWEEIG